jgi:hypothetical protein
VRDFLCTISDALRDLSLGDWLGIVTLAIVVVSLFLTIRWHRRTGHAELVAEQVSVYENPNAPAGWQFTVVVRNEGPAPAHKLEVWLTESDGTMLARRYPGDELVGPGERDALVGEPPREPQLGPFGRTPKLPTAGFPGAMHIWIGWQDVRKPQERDTGIRI